MAITKTLPSQASKKPKGLLVSLLVILGLLLSALILRQRIFDYAKLYNYLPPTAIVELASDDTMNSYTRHVFYVNHPQLMPTVAAFRKVCPEDETDIVLGCYHVGQNGIYIYQVTDPSLAGVQQVTAAHEVLHAVYARLTSRDRAMLNNELEDYYKHGLVNQRVAAEIQLYQKTEPNSVYDEMSCTFGTEIANLPAGLRAYYSQFFTNRMKIVGYEQQYESAFTSRLNQVTSDDQQLATLQAQITSKQQVLQTQLAQINAQRAVLQNLANSDQLQYNQEVPGFNELVQSYNAGVTTLQATITNYNQLVADRNSIAGAFDSLTSAIDTRIIPEQTK